MSDLVNLSWGIRYDDFITEAWPLIRAHWSEVGTHRDVLRLDPDHGRYRALEESGRLHILTARVDGKIVGYFFMLVAPHPRDRQATVGTDDIIFVKPEFRRHRVGPLMLTEAFNRLGEMGVNIVMFREKAYRHGGGYLKRFGLKPQETVYSMVLKAPHVASECAA